MQFLCLWTGSYPCPACQPGSQPVLSVCCAAILLPTSHPCCHSPANVPPMLMPTMLSTCLPAPCHAGMQGSTAEVEEELMQLWSSVEKDREAAAVRRRQHAERLRQRREQRQTKLAPLSSSMMGVGGAGPAPAAGRGGEAAGVQDPQHKGGWQRLVPADDEQAAGAGSDAAVADVEAGAAGVAQRMRQAIAASSSAGIEPEPAAASAFEGRSLLGAGDRASGSSDQAPPSPLRVPPHLPRIRTASSELAQLAADDLDDLQAAVRAAGPPAAAPVAVQARAVGGSSSDTLPADVEAGVSGGSASVAQQADEWGGGAGSTSQQQREREEEGEEGQQAGGQREQQQADQAAGFWHTLRGMLGDIYLVARGPRRARRCRWRCGLPSSIRLLPPPASSTMHHRWGLACCRRRCWRARLPACLPVASVLPRAAPPAASCGGLDGPLAAS